MSLSLLFLQPEPLTDENSIEQSIIDLNGEVASKASLLKFMGNVLILSTMETVAEANVLSEK